MNVLDTLKERGFVNQTTNDDELRRMLDTERVTVYAGFDPTADSLHVGHLVPTMALAHLQRAGHRVIALVGGGTAHVGDPSGKSEARQLLSPEQIEGNLAGLRENLGRFLDFAEDRAIMVDNADWLLKLNYIEFLRDVGRYFAVNQMIKAKGYAERLEREQGLSFIEFNYLILQAYDYLVLNERYGCKLQVGGADQWGNIVAGVDIVRRVRGESAHALTFNLLTTATGEKMGKTVGGAVWLSSDRLPVYDFYQYWRNVDDRDIEKLFSIFTFLPMDEVRELGRLDGKSTSEINASKERLAIETTTLVHGEANALKARDAARALFAGGGDLSAAPSTIIPRARLEEGIALLDLLVETGLMPSKKEARRKVEERGVYVGADAAPATDPRARIGLDALDERGELLLRVGKKHYHRIVAG
jgi:tyrosyl-tRNA synthetase